MNVLIVIPELGAGGAEAVAAELAHGLATEGAAVRVASSGGWRADALERAGVAMVPVPLRGRRLLLNAIRAVHRSLAMDLPDVIHAHNVKAALAARLAVAQTGGRRPPVIATLHGVPDAAYPAAARILRRCADVVVAVSPGVANRIVAAGYPAARLQVIENGIAPMPTPDRAEARAHLGVPHDAQLVVCIARLVPQKRHDLLVTAWCAMPRTAVLLIAGAGENAAKIEGQVGAAGLGDRIRLLGERQDVDRLLAAADVAVLPTDWEGLPISLLEAMSAGVPVVASAVPELVATLSGAAELVEPGSAAALATGLDRVLTDPDRAAQLAAAGRQLVADRFAVPRMHAAYRHCFAHVLGTEEIPA